MTDWVIWYIVSTMLGWLAFPIAFRLLPNLPDRGIHACRTLGLLIWGFSFWLLATLGLLPFSLGGILFAAAVLAGLSLWALLGIQPVELWSWIKAHKKWVIASELLFLIAFGGWAIVRAANPEALGTEKPMELAFINAILRSPTLPPHDPWLSGYAISYYYFGFVLTAMLAKLAGTSGSVAFNLGIALVFALSAVGSFGILLNMLNQANRKPGSPRPAFTFAALLAPLYVLIVSNLEGVLHVLHTRGFFWQRNADGGLTSSFWRWLDLQDLTIPPQEPFAWVPTRFWWWWRASRVLQDYDLNLASKEIIDEFPFFSFLLADLHPHVLAMPFAFLAITLAFNMILSPKARSDREPAFSLNQTWIQRLSAVSIPLGLALLTLGLIRLQASIVSLGFVFLLAGAWLVWQLFQQIESRRAGGETVLDLRISLKVNLPPAQFLMTAVALGGMAFLNTWDFPVYVFIFAGAYGLNQFLVQGRSLRQALEGFLIIGVALGLSGILLYLPFYLGFSSQAGGILPNLIYPTRGIHLWVMFAPLLTPVLVYLVYLTARTRSWKALLRGLGTAAGIFAAAWGLSLLLGAAISLIGGVGDFYLASLGAQNSGELFAAAVQRRFSSPGAWLTLLLLTGFLFGLTPAIQKMQPTPAKDDPSDADTAAMTNPAENRGLAAVFALLLILTGLVLVAAPEFLFLRDLFGWRMNTIFKFYFQAWLVWSIAAAFATVILLQRLKNPWGGILQAGIVILLLASLVYPGLSLWTKTNGFRPETWTLDSAAYFERSFPDEAAAIEWLKQAPLGVIAEAVSATGGSYTEYARISTLTGLPAVLGWVGHENQWRGGNEVMGTRQQDMERLFCGRDWEETRLILDQYGIRYVIVGNLERATYSTNNSNCPVGLVDAKFNQNLQVVFQSATTTIFEYSGAAQP